MRLDEFLKKNPGAEKKARQWAIAADVAADAMDRARSSEEFSKAKKEYEKARGKLLAALLSLSGIQPWTEDDLGSLSGTQAWTENGLGLLSVANVLNQTDPSLYGLYRAVKDKVLAGKKPALAKIVRAEFECTIEACLFVYPDFGPLNALVNGCDRACRVAETIPRTQDSTEPKEAEGDYRTRVAAELKRLTADDFWISQGTSSLKGFLDRFFPSGSTNLPPAADEKTARRTLKKYDWEWKKLRETLKVRDENLLRQILGFRQQLTDDLIKVATKKVLEAESTIKFYGNALRWVVATAAGSTNLSSDYDASLDGPAAESIVKEFNRLFRKWTLGEIDASGKPATASDKSDYGLESAYVFDVNIYTSGYLRKEGRRFLAHDVPDPDFWPIDEHDRAEAENIQDIYGLMKIRRYVEKEDWDQFRLQLLKELSSSPKKKTDGLLAEVDRLWIELKGEVDKRIVAVGKTYPGMPDDNIKARAENELYQEALDQVEAIRLLLFEEAPGDHNKTIRLVQAEDEARLAFIRWQGRAGVFAQEAYHTSGAVRDVVANLQLRRNVELSDGEILCSVNEQIGDLFKEIDHALRDRQANWQSSDLDLAIKSAKYMVRLGNAALALNARIVQAILQSQLGVDDALSGLLGASPRTDAERALDIGTKLNAQLDLQTFCTAWLGTTARLLEIKTDEKRFRNEDNTWNAEARRRIKLAAWRRGSSQHDATDDLSLLLIQLAAAVNVQYRDRLKSSALPRFLKGALELSMAWAKQRELDRKKKALELAGKASQTPTSQLPRNNNAEAPR